MAPPADPLDRISIQRDLKGDSVSLPSRLNVADQLSQLVAGQKVQGQVLAKLVDQSFLVEVANANVRVVLPAETKVGDKLNLSFVSLLPRPSFLLESKQSSISTVTVETPLDVAETVNTPARSPDGTNLAQGTASQSASTTLTATARLIAQFLRQGRPAINLSELIQVKPLVQSKAEIHDTAQLAQQLQSAIKSSGLFYESHVAQWANQKLARASLQAEPQFQLSQSDAQDTVSTDNNKLTALSQLVEQQLDTLDRQSFQWRGEILPEVPFQWEITRQKEQSPSTKVNSEAQQVWQTTVKFALPELGQIAATIYLVNNQLQFSIRGESDEVAQTLLANGHSLSEALDTAGAKLTGFTVNSDEKI